MSQPESLSELDALINSISDISEPKEVDVDFNISLSNDPKETSSSNASNFEALMSENTSNPRRYGAKKAQIKQRRQPGKQARGAASGSDLENILGDVAKKVQSLDISEGNQGICAYCKEPILREVVDVAALGKKYHKEHFYCVMCKQLANPDKYYEKQGDIHCAPCFEKKVLPQCARCMRPITDQCITALERKWHPQCFTCKSCSGGFPSGEFFEKDGQPYCKADYLRLFSQICKMCNRHIEGECLQALGSSWHPGCFHCPTCRKPFGPNFFQHDGFAYCEPHYLQIKGVRR